eukprot:4984667-Pyramimonas_sp.AAC.1
MVSARLGVLSGAAWGVLEASWAVLRPSWMGYLGSLWGRLWSRPGLSHAVLEVPSAGEELMQ